MTVQEVEAAAKPADLFGPVTQDSKLRRAAKRKYRTLLQIVHPDKGGTKELFIKLDEFYTAWLSGLAAPSVKKTAATYKAGSWEIGELLAQGTISNVYRTTGGNVVKINRKASTTHLMHAEATALPRVQGAPHAEFYPLLVEHGDVGDKAYTVMPSLEKGWHTLAQVLATRPRERLLGADYAWMHRRLLGALAGAHRLGVVHGAVLPDNVLIEPSGHGVKLIDWAFSGTPGEKIRAHVKTWTDFYPLDKTLTPELDVYMAHSLMRWALGPGEDRQRNFSRGCMTATPQSRPTAAQALTEYDDLLYRLYGRRKFRPFQI